VRRSASGSGLYNGTLRICRVIAEVHDNVLAATGVCVVRCRVWLWLLVPWYTDTKILSDSAGACLHWRQACSPW
jgi:hypothetical protein